MTADIRKMLEQVLDAYVKADEKAPETLRRKTRRLMSSTKYAAI